mmetsp:Transcript_18641/g.70797  ORF Transcript_18641/g.70797 Transcript_18641/m.70797 type:complete len:232 (-) Transcript_18641:2404-3099(-)
MSSSDAVHSGPPDSSITSSRGWSPWGGAASKLVAALRQSVSSGTRRPAVAQAACRAREALTPSTERALSRAAHWPGMETGLSRGKKPPLEGRGRRRGMGAAPLAAFSALSALSLAAATRRAWGTMLRTSASAAARSVSGSLSAASLRPRPSRASRLTGAGDSGERGPQSWPEPSARGTAASSAAVGSAMAGRSNGDGRGKGACGSSSGIPISASFRRIATACAAVAAAIVA